GEHTVASLRTRIAALEGRAPAESLCDGEIAGNRVMPFGITGLDDQLAQGGLPLGALNEIHGAPQNASPTLASPTLASPKLASPKLASHGVAPALSGFAFAIGARLLATAPEKSMLWVDTPLARREAGRPYGPGLKAFGLPPERILFVTARSMTDALWAMEEGLRCRSLALVAGDLWGDHRAWTMTATRRLHLAAAASGVTALALRHAASPGVSAAETRWHVAPAAQRERAPPQTAQPDPRYALGRPAWALSLVRQRGGATPHADRPVIVEWDPHGSAFIDPPALSGRPFAQLRHGSRPAIGAQPKQHAPPSAGQRRKVG
ncbi:MAG: hypothetical protein AAF638_06890, partial [Pseudomonadota bacterium]